MNSMTNKISTIWSDIDSRIVPNQLGDIKIAINIKAVETALDNIVRTFFGERVMRPEFGSNLKAVIFENTNSAMMLFIERQLKENIERWEPRVNVTWMGFYEDPNKNSVSIGLKFTIKGHQQIFKHEIEIKGEV